MRRVRRSRPSWSVPSQCAPFIAMNRSDRLVCANPYGATRSASTAAASMTTTMTPPIVPRGLRRSIWTQTSAYQGRVRGKRLAATATAAPTDDVGSAGSSLLVPDPRVQKRIGEVDEEVEADDHRRDDQVHRLDDRIVELGERLEEEEPDARQ